MSLCDHVLVLRNIAVGVPECPRKEILLEEIDKLIVFCEGHEKADSALSDTLHEVCNECAKLRAQQGVGL